MQHLQPNTILQGGKIQNSKSDGGKEDSVTLTVVLCWDVIIVLFP